MALPTSGQLSISQIRDEQVAGGIASTYSLRQLSANAYYTSPDAISEFYGWGNIVKSGLVLYLDANAGMSYPGSGTTWTDLSGNSQNGTLTNGPTYTSSNGGGIVFDGTNDYVLGSGSVPGVTNAVTIIVWAKMNNLNNRNPLFVKYQTPTAPYGYLLEVGQTSLWTRSLRFFCQNSGTRSSDYRGTVQLSDNTIYMLTAVSAPSSSVMKMFYNNTVMGATQANVNWTQTVDWGQGTNPYYVGAYPPSVGIYAGCTIYNTLVYNRTLSDAEVTQNWNAMKGRYGY